MLDNLVVPKYADIGSLLVEVQINGTLIKKKLIDLGAMINVMNRETMKKLLN